MLHVDIPKPRLTLLIVATVILPLVYTVSHGAHGPAGTLSTPPSPTSVTIAIESKSFLVPAGQVSDRLWLESQEGQQPIYSLGRIDAPPTIALIFRYLGGRSVTVYDGDNGTVVSPKL